ncbi:hypothetical protein C7H84_34015 [Burkholderia sp. Nafp2/4-1b]|uniref:phosphatase PAP2 family protein n=1 Tax=Burkholderia sp. Nafp2/4-1b TaxID=2116686 RepID=UPI000EF89B24|nr:phosphatase PAP2 family protein [Burkholderia sp. Nafp2/4-1b]RKT98974.1 hypothetical protein C7H84_34015 [Burkholderia sp. Nafp2/4-1b]
MVSLLKPSDNRRRFLVVAIFYILAILFTIAFIDRAASTWSNSYLQRNEVFVWMSRLSEPIVPLACVGLLVSGCAMLAGWHPSDRVHVLLTCCLAAIVAVVLKDQLKFLFGRTWTETFIDSNPSWIQNGVYGFLPLNGGKGWASFPSGHAAVIVAPMVVLWNRARSFRWLWAMCILIVIVGLFGANYHFVSDILAGALLGIFSGRLTIAMTAIKRKNVG